MEDGEVSTSGRSRASALSGRLRSRSRSRARESPPSPPPPLPPPPQVGQHAESAGCGKSARLLTTRIIGTSSLNELRALISATPASERNAVHESAAVARVDSLVRASSSSDVQLARDISTARVRAWLAHPANAYGRDAISAAGVFRSAAGHVADDALLDDVIDVVERGAATLTASAATRALAGLAMLGRASDASRLGRAHGGGSVGGDDGRGCGGRRAHAAIVVARALATRLSPDNPHHDLNDAAHLVALSSLGALGLHSADLTGPIARAVAARAARAAGAPVLWTVDAIVGLQRCGVTDATLLCPLVAAADARLHTLPPDRAITLLAALADFGSALPLDSGLIDRVAAFIAARAGAVPPDHLQLAFHAASSLRLSATLLPALSEAAAARASELAPADVARVLRFFGDVRFGDGAATTAVAARATVLAAHFTSATIAGALWGVAELAGLADADAAAGAALVARAVVIAGELDESASASCAWAAAALGARAADVRALAAGALMRARTACASSGGSASARAPASLSAPLASLLLQAHYFCVGESGAAPLVEPELLEPLRNAITSRPVGWASSFGNDVVAALRGFYPAEGAVTAEAPMPWGHEVDALVRVGDRLVAVEADGPSHFTAFGGPPRPTGSTRLRDEMLRRHGYAVVAVAHFEWAAEADGHVRREALRARINAAAQSETV